MQPRAQVLGTKLPSPSAFVTNTLPTKQSLWLELIALKNVLLVFHFALKPFGKAT